MATNKLTTVNFARFIKSTPRKFCRDFGLMFAVLFLLFGFWRPHHGFDLRPLYLVGASLLGIVSAVRPELLRPFAGLWRGLAEVLHLLVSPVMLFVLFFFVIAPMGKVMQLTGWDPLGLKRKPGQDSYWRKRAPASPSAESFRQQF